MECALRVECQFDWLSNLLLSSTVYTSRGATEAWPWGLRLFLHPLLSDTVPVFCFLATTQ